MGHELRANDACIGSSQNLFIYQCPKASSLLLSILFVFFVIFVTKRSFFLTFDELEESANRCSQSRNALARHISPECLTQGPSGKLHFRRAKYKLALLPPYNSTHSRLYSFTRVPMFAPLIPPATRKGVIYILPLRATPESAFYATQAKRSA